MTAVLGWVLNTSLGRSAAGALAIIFSVLMLYHYGSRAGANRQKEKADARDRKAAAAVRERFITSRRRVVRRDDIVYRD